MPREKEGYRDNVERIKDMFPDKELLKTKDVARFTGYSVWTVRRRFPLKNGFISVADFARLISI